MGLVGTIVADAWNSQSKKGSVLAIDTWDKADEYIVFVHGWNMTYDESQSYGETMFKRLWQRGYKGRYASVRWPTLTGLLTYNDSEYRAWKSGEGVKQFVNSLPNGYTRNLVAHSMGNIVVGSALQKGATINNYSLLNAAVPAACYDDSNTLDQGWGYTTPHNDPDAGTRSLSYRYQLTSVNGNLTNFHLSGDSALAAWELNNKFLKPHKYNLGASGYYYDPNASAGHRLGISYLTIVGRFVTTVHEGMSYVAVSPTKTVGADGRTGGAIDTSVDMNTYSFGDIHSAEFMLRLQQTTPFYERLMTSFDIIPNP